MKCDFGAYADREGPDQTVRNRPSLSAYKAMGYCRINQRTEKRALHCSVANIF